MRDSGVLLLCYAPSVKPWASDLIDDSDWILGPVGDLRMALDAIRAWVEAEDTSVTRRTQTVQGMMPATLPCSSSTESYDRAKDKIDAVMCYDEYGVQMASLIAQVSASDQSSHRLPVFVSLARQTEIPTNLGPVTRPQALGLPGSKPRAIDTVRSKLSFRHACSVAGIPHPRFLHINLQPTAISGRSSEAELQGGTPRPSVTVATTSLEDSLQSAPDLVAPPGGAPAVDDECCRISGMLEASLVHFPVVVKPVGCAGSFAVTRAEDLTQLVEAVREFKRTLPAYLDTCGLSGDSTAATGELVLDTSSIPIIHDACKLPTNVEIQSIDPWQSLHFDSLLCHSVLIKHGAYLSLLRRFARRRIHRGPRGGLRTTNLSLVFGIPVLDH